MVRVDLRTVTLNIPPQEVITRDNVPVRVNAVAYFRIIDPERAIVQVENFLVATSQIAQTTLQASSASTSSTSFLSERDKINTILQEIIDEATSPWGIRSDRRGEGRRDPNGDAASDGAPGGSRARAAGEGDRLRPGLRALKDAANVMATNPIALQLRYLQTILEMSSERATIMVLLLDRSGGPFWAEHRLRLTEGRRLELRRDPVSGRWVVVAPSRAHRPGTVRPRRSSLTIARAARSTRGGRRPHRRDLRDRPTWAAAGHARVARSRRPQQVSGVRAVAAGGDRTDGLFARRAAVGRQEVVHSPRHVRTIAELGSRSSSSSPRRARAAAAREAGFSYVHALLNEGAGAGASLTHSHSQLVWLEQEPPLVAQERAARGATAAASSATFSPGSASSESASSRSVRG